VIIASTAVLRAGYRMNVTASPGGHLSFLQSAYFAVETVTTVGYGDYSFRGQPAWLMASATGLMLAGALFVAVFFAMVTNVIVSRRISESLGRQRITGLTGHVIVVGVPVIIADATLPPTLESARLASASAVAVLTSDDLANLETGLAVRDQRAMSRCSSPG
jgi:voltage-gated potassium channel Kch